MPTLSYSPTQKPDFPDGYKLWLKTEHGCEINEITFNHYNAMCDAVKRCFDDCIMWNTAKAGLRELYDKYLIKSGFPLLQNFAPDIYVKPFDSFLLKTYRYNILLNSHYPKPPRRGWMLPPDWYSNINDVFRTTFTVKYLDGVEFLLNYMLDVGKQTGFNIENAYEARIEGYYAAHLYYKKSCDVPKLDFTTETREFSFEIQITTEIKEMIKNILHPFYQRSRLRERMKGKDWRWDYGSDEFIANNLGHILHYVEGAIVQVRERQRNQQDD